MHRLAVLLLVCAVGCGDPASAPDATTPRQQPDDTPVEENEQPTAELAQSKTRIGDVELTQKTVVDGKLSLLVPDGFSEMTEAALELKYPSSRRPTLVYTNDTGSINVAINHTKSRMPLNEIDAFHRNMDGMFRNLYPSATWFASGIIHLQGRKWLNLDLRTPAIDTEIRNLMAGTSVDGRLLLVSFNVTKELESGWLPVGEAILQSLRVLD